MSEEFVCCECGQTIVAFGPRSEFGLCSACIILPGWPLDPHLRKRFGGPNMPPLPEKEGGISSGDGA